MPARLAWLLGWRRALAGRYDAGTETLFRHAWTRGGGRRHLLDWLRFRRERGRVVSGEQVMGLARLNAGHRDALAWRAWELIVEQLPEALAKSGQSLDWLVPYAQRSPPIAAALLRASVRLDASSTRLAELCERQGVWRSELFAWLIGAKGRLCVVGNAGHLSGSGLGEEIDAHECVLRFNKWRSDRSSRAGDLGDRLDVWVCNPTFVPQALRQGFPVPRWVVLTGPDALYNRAGKGEDWVALLRLRDAGAQVVTFPLAVWGGLVEILGAPPSAGLMMLEWMRREFGGLDGVTIAGFGTRASVDERYHHAGRQMRPGRRHDWLAEAGLLDAWEGEGMRRLRRI
jgi:hypothetical protein